MPKNVPSHLVDLGSSEFIRISGDFLHISAKLLKFGNIMLCSQLADEVVNLSLGEQRIFYYPTGLYFDYTATSYVLMFLFWSGDQLQYTYLYAAPTKATKQD